jgi:large subunit ribosomal protein L6
MTSFSKTIQIPSQVSIFCKKNQLIFQGPLGILNFNPRDHIKGWSGFQLELLKQQNEQWELLIKNTEKTPKVQAFGKTLVSLIRQKIFGVCQGFFFTLDIQGIGYRVVIDQGRVSFKLGYSHEILLDCPSSLRVFSPKPNLLCVYSVDYHKLTLFCETVRRLKKPEPYKGKGIRFQGQIVPLRTGKKK